jgi:Sigma-70, region 4/Bacterial RNA polymerase, alpha chain C terminal domain
MHVAELGLSPKALACLDAARITEVEQLTARSFIGLIQSGEVGPSELYEIVCQLNQHALSLPARPGKRMRIPSQRNREMLRLRIIERLTLAEIGERTGISRERVRQILNVHFGLTGTRPTNARDR